MFLSITFTPLLREKALLGGWAVWGCVRTDRLLNQPDGGQAFHSRIDHRCYMCHGVHSVQKKNGCFLLIVQGMPHPLAVGKLAKERLRNELRSIRVVLSTLSKHRRSEDVRSPEIVYDMDVHIIGGGRHDSLMRNDAVDLHSKSLTFK